MTEHTQAASNLAAARAPTEHDAAKQWRLNHGWSVEKLSALSGYSHSAIIWFERGRGPTNKPIDPFAFWRYKRICHSIEVDSDLNFTWTRLSAG